MPIESEETINYSPVFQIREQRRTDLKFIEEGEKTLEEYRKHLREAQALADSDLSPESRENLLKLIEQFTLKLQAHEESLNAHKARFGIEASQPMKIIQP